jgi:predicted P-loop ATPase
MSPSEFLSALGGPRVIRAIWPKKQLGECPAGQKDAYTFYGQQYPFDAIASLNTLGYSIFYSANDPGSADLKEIKVEKLSVIYRDHDTDENAAFWRLAGGEELPPHFHIITSPGKSQSLWLIEPIPAAHQAAIHGKMATFHDHDKSTSGAARLLRLPGFANTKYASRPLVSAVRMNDAPPIQAAVVLRYFGLEAKPDPNISRMMHRAQSGSGGAQSAMAYQTVEHKPARGATTPELEAERLHARVTGHNQKFETRLVVPVLALIDPLERGDWFRVGAALHFMFDGSEDGLELFDAWSQLAPEKYEHGACAALWRGYKAERENPAHWGTLRAMAARLPSTAASKARHTALEEHALLNLPERLSIQVTAFEWRETMLVGTTKMIADPGSSANARQAIEHWEPSLHFDEFTREITTDRGLFQDRDENALFMNAYDAGNRWTQTLCSKTVDVVAQENKRNPALDYIAARRGQWDGKERLNTLFVDHLGAADDHSIRELTQLIFVAMVRRILQPGCKFDYMPILQGAGGLGKSAIFRLLCPNPQWFTDAPSLDEDAKRFYPSIQGKMCVEFAELAGKSKGDIQKIKKIITQTTDEYIRMYGRRMTREPRVAVFIGTTNEDTPLRDMKGNRRFPLIKVTKELNFANLLAEKDQIWAEAVFLEEIWGGLQLSHESAVKMDARQAEALEYEEGVQEFLDELAELKHGFVSSHTIREYFGVGHRGRIAEANKAKFAISQVKARMTTLGWILPPSTMRINGKVKRGLYKRNEADQIIEIVFSETDGLHHSPQGIDT